MAGKSIILVFHGSRRASAVEEAESFVHTLRRSLPHAQVGVGFLQFAEPTFSQALITAAGSGPQEIIVLPMFALTGFHVEHDLPEAAQAFRRDFPEIPVRLLPHLSAQPAFFRWIESFLRELTCLSSDPDSV